MRPRSVRFDAIDVIDFLPCAAAADVLPAGPRATLDVRCASGTYLRALARDLGQRLETPALASSLRRTEVGDWLVDEAMPMIADPTPAQRPTEQQVRAAMRGIDQLLPQAPVAELRISDARLVAAGGRIGSARVSFTRGVAPDVRGTTKSPATPVDEQPIVLCCRGVVLGIAAHVVGRDGSPILQPRVVDPAASDLLRHVSSSSSDAPETVAEPA